MGSLIAINLLSNISSPLATYRDALPSGSASIGFSIGTETPGQRVGVQICNDTGVFENLSTDTLIPLLQGSAAEVGDAINCSFDMSKLAARYIDPLRNSNETSRSEHSLDSPTQSLKYSLD